MIEPLAHPLVVYPDADLSCGLSTSGILICGDRKSIDRVMQALHAEQAIVPYLRERIVELEQQLKDIKA